MKEVIIYLCLISLFLGFCAAQSVAKDYVPSDIGEGSYLDVLKALEDRGDKIILKDEDSIMALYRYNKDIANLFKFSDGKLKSVTTTLSDQPPALALLNFEINCRRFGNPKEVILLGEKWGEGFVVIWENNDEQYRYSIRDIPLGYDDRLQKQEVVWNKKN